MPLRSRLRRALAELFAMAVNMQFPLLDLPNEVIILVIEQVSTRSELSKLARTSRHIQRLAEPVLYRELFIRTRKHLSRIFNALCNGEGDVRLATIRSLTVPCESAQNWRFDPLHRILRDANNLRNFEFESPNCNFDRFENALAWDRMTRNMFETFHQATMTPTTSPKPLQHLRKRLAHHEEGLKGIG